MPGSLLGAKDPEMNPAPSFGSEGIWSTSPFSVKSFCLQALHNHSTAGRPSVSNVIIPPLKLE